MTLIPQEDFESVKIAMRMNGNIPNKKLVVEFYEKGMNELGNLSLGQIDELCREDKIIEEDNRKVQGRAVRRRMASWMGALAGADYTENRYLR